jgi:hypothetical protein
MNINQEILNDAGDGNIVNIQLVSLDEKKQQVEGSFKLR